MYFRPYSPPLLLSNKHLQTIYPTLFRKPGISYNRERIETDDDDFLDLDWEKNGFNKLAIVSHGLEGSSDRCYVTGMARALNDAGWDVLAWNFRSCSGEINRQPRMYHSGTIDDLHTVISHAILKEDYPEIALVGFSMGGNQILIYLGQSFFQVPDVIRKAVVFSVPADLKSSARQLGRWSNKIYMKRFLKFLYKKISAKAKMFPGLINADHFHQVKNFKDFDDRYTAPLHDFKNAEDYWEKCSSKPFIPAIKIPTLIVDAQNDPFLTPECYPVAEARDNRNITLEIPQAGGHIGFISGYFDGLYWSEERAIAFLNK